jgi:organic hydroperoxide reductase OsmC/OhrA
MNGSNALELTQEKDFRFAVDFGNGRPLLYADENPPLGQGSGPNPEQLLSSAVANCLSASLLFALRKFKQEPGTLRTHAEAVTGRNEAGRLRVQRIDVRLTLGKPAAQLEHLDRAVAQFEEFCTVTQSVRAAIPVHVTVVDSEGAVLKKDE